jgi:hypothetical protein
MLNVLGAASFNIYQYLDDKLLIELHAQKLICHINFIGIRLYQLQ